MKHRDKVTGEQLINLRMAQQLKTKNINAVTMQLFQATKATKATSV